MARRRTKGRTRQATRRTDVDTAFPQAMLLVASLISMLSGYLPWVHGHVQGRTFEMSGMMFPLGGFGLVIPSTIFFALGFLIIALYICGITNLIAFRWWFPFPPGIVGLACLCISQLNYWQLKELLAENRPDITVSRGIGAFLACFAFSGIIVLSVILRQKEKSLKVKPLPIKTFR